MARLDTPLRPKTPPYWCPDRASRSSTRTGKSESLTLAAGLTVARTFPSIAGERNLTRAFRMRSVRMDPRHEAIVIRVMISV